ncbi:hypothetical protein OG357_15210 [Streptomyces sp. NBC_01255]|uniref:hypothetical protein n=1 Tax=Streptomyces sp. NBC_01255 TaxID=2903798 RepID=UPI002E34AAC2|nr:hypothetical protein [Streptomyces sp. NBC_01255]
MSGLCARRLRTSGLRARQLRTSGLRASGLRTRRLRAAVAGAALAGALLAVSGCASSVDPIERLGRKAAERMATPDATTVAEGTAARISGHAD